MKNSEFLKKKYSDLHQSEEVEAAEWWSGKKVGRKPTERIQNLLDRFSEIINWENIVEKQRGIEAVKELLHQKFIIKPDQVPNSYWKQQQRLARELGHGEIEITKEMKAQQTEILRADQISSLDYWIDYLASDDAPYPDWLKYWAVRSILNRSEYDKEKKTFGKRDETTVKPFPALNQEALAKVLNAVKEKYEKKEIDLSYLNEEQQKEFGRLLGEESFAKLYAF